MSSTRRGWIEGQIELAPPASAAAPGSRLGSSASVSRAMSSTGTSTQSSRALRLPASTISTGRGFHAAFVRASRRRPRLRRAGARSPRAAAASPRARCAGGAGGRGRERLEPLEREEEVRAALGRRHRVDLVDDHGLDRREGLARLRGQEQVQRLGRRDEDVRRRARDAGALRGRRVAGAHGHGGDAERVAPPLGGRRDSGERRAQVALDVDGERLERRDVEHAAALASSRARA